MTGSLDSAVRVWHKERKNTPLQVENTNEVITALAYSPNGKWLVLGTYSGKCLIYESSSIGKLNYKSQIDCKNRRGKFSSGRKIGGVTFINDREFLVTTADSRIRLISVDDCLQKVKFKGDNYKNENLQLLPSIDSHGNLISCGSEDGQVYIWSRSNVKSDYRIRK